MKHKDLKTLLLRDINSLDRSKYAKCPGIDFTRSRKLPFNTLVETMLRMEGKSMSNELISAFPKASETPSVSAFFQQRSKLKAGVFDDLFHSLVLSVDSIQSPKTFNGLRRLCQVNVGNLLAIFKISPLTLLQVNFLAFKTGARKFVIVYFLLAGGQPASV